MISLCGNKSDVIVVYNKFDDIDNFDIDENGYIRNDKPKNWLRKIFNKLKFTRNKNYDQVEMIIM